MATLMKAMVYDRYGPPEALEMRDVDTPVPGDRDVVIRVEAASVNRSDWEGLIGKPLYARIGGLRRPRRPILGSDVAGRVEEVGSAVESFRPGDQVFGDVMYHGGSAFAEYVCVPEAAPIVHKPATLTFAEASTLPQAALIALQATSGRIESGDRVLVNGAGGGAGAFAVQMAKTAGAEVTGVDNGMKQEFMRSVGADHVLDYTRTDYTKSDTRYDFILDLVCERSMFAIRRAVAPGGRYSVVGGSVPALLSAATVGRLIDRRPEDRGSHGAAQQARSAPGRRYGRHRRFKRYRRADLLARRSARGAAPSRGRTRPRKARHRHRLTPTQSTDVAMSSSMVPGLYNAKMPGTRKGTSRPPTAPTASTAQVPVPPSACDRPWPCSSANHHLDRRWGLYAPGYPILECGWPSAPACRTA